MELRFQGSWPWRESNSWRQADREAEEDLKLAGKNSQLIWGINRKGVLQKANIIPSAEAEKGAWRCLQRGAALTTLAFLSWAYHSSTTKTSMNPCPRIHAASLSSYQVSNNTMASYLFLNFYSWNFKGSWALLTTLISFVSWNFTLPGRAFLCHSWKRTKTGFQEWDRMSHLGWYWFFPALIILLVFKHLLFKGNIILMFNKKI